MKLIKLLSIDERIKTQIKQWVQCYMGFQVVLVVKNLPAHAGDTGSTPTSGRSPEEGNGNPLLYSCLGNPVDRGAR